MSPPTTTSAKPPRPSILTSYVEYYHRAQAKLVHEQKLLEDVHSTRLSFLRDMEEIQHAIHGYLESLDKLTAVLDSKTSNLHKVQKILNLEL